MKRDWCKNVGNRLIVTKSPLFGRFPVEVKLIEVSPSRKRVKFRHESGADLWHDADDYQIEEVLPATPPSSSSARSSSEERKEGT